MPDWISELHTRGLAGAALTALDVLEPLGPLGAQALYIGSPIAGLFGWKPMVDGLAAALEAPDGIDQLRTWLASEPPKSA